MALLTWLSNLITIAVLDPQAAIFLIFLATAPIWIIIAGLWLWYDFRSNRR